MKPADIIIRTILESYPDVQAIYMFGSYGTPDEWPSSDVDIALLMPPGEEYRLNSLALIETQSVLQSALGRTVDLVDLRRASTVFQKEVLAGGRRIYTADEYGADEFEMLTFSYYQKLNDERREVLEAFLGTGKAYAV